MKESVRIAKLFEDLYDGSPWIDVTILNNLNQLTADQAARRLYENWNTIWEIVNHMISWRETVLKRVQGQIISSPAHNYILPLKHTSEAAWKDTIRRLEDSQSAWLAFLKTFKSGNFELTYPGNGMTHYEHLHGILQHDAYHLGQIVIMAKRVKEEGKG